MLVAGLCRLFANRGLRVAPFKAQNMSLNSCVTRNGEEIARATAIQAAGAHQEPLVHMNPILLKPKMDDVAQLIIHGKPYADVDAKSYFASDLLQARKLDAIMESFAYLQQHYDLVIAEGAGSCAEPNLRARDVVNMGIAHRIDARVYIVADIDKGGAFADLIGATEVMKHTEPSDLDRVHGFVLNKFRGDPSLLAPAIEFTQGLTGKPITGVLPYFHDLNFEEEDRVREFRLRDFDIDIAVLYLPHISNANDLDFLADERGVQVRYVRDADRLGFPDAIIVPGTKNTTRDLAHLHRMGLPARLQELAGRVPIIGICGGYQMLAHHLSDPDCLESDLGSMEGLGLLDVDMEFLAGKTLAQRHYEPTAGNFLRGAGSVEGYEIHSGIAHYRGATPAYESSAGPEGAVDGKRQILGTFIHDLFANPGVVRTFVNDLRERKRLPPLTGSSINRRSRAETTYDLLAEALATHCRF